LTKYGVLFRFKKIMIFTIALPLNDAEWTSIGPLSPPDLRQMVNKCKEVDEFHHCEVKIDTARIRCVLRMFNELGELTSMAIFNYGQHLSALKLKTMVLLLEGGYLKRAPHRRSERYRTAQRIRRFFNIALQLDEDSLDVLLRITTREPLRPILLGDVIESLKWFI